MAQAPAAVITLQVAEAQSKDVGRGIARLDPKDMADIGVQVGDIILITGKRATPAKVMPAYVEERGESTLQVDGITRENAQVGIGDSVHVQRTESAEARAIIVTPLVSEGGTFHDNDMVYIRRLLEGRPVTVGDKVRVTLLGTRPQAFSVVDVEPKGVVIIGALTEMHVRGERVTPSGKTGVTYEDIGGLHREIQRIREMIELPLRHPELFERLGIEAPKGVLLLGPPGTGKTLIARAVANETDAYFVTINGPEIIHKYYGESEAHLRSIFEEATKSAPAIIFLDELDAIASKREEIRGDQQVERRVVAQLLSLMDGLKSRGQVVVIGATNIPDVLDPALRRPGRFDREINISAPDKVGRREILQIHTRGMPLEDVDLERLADITHGFVGADIEALAREAAMTALRKMLPRFRLDEDYIPFELLLDLKVKMDDFEEALTEVEPSALREVFTEVPDVKWEDVGGLEAIKQELMETIEWPLKYPEVFERAGARPPKGIILTGSPGTGKTLVAKAVASQSGANFISVKGPALMSMWVGESERGIREMFKKAKQASPCIVFFDEIDAIAPVRGTGSTNVTERVVSQLLTELDGIEDLRGVVVLAATNRPDMVDPALLRPGRFDRRFDLDVPDERVRLEIFRIHTREQPLAPDVDLANLACRTEGLVGADLAAICQHAAMLAIHDFVAGLSAPPTDQDLAKLRIDERHFEAALAAQQRRTTLDPATPPHQRSTDGQATG